ncbi:MAG: ribonuclease P protein component [Gammaproteobacteria bacterium]|nr:ribonuclease P protein component [Gammaproteobacteria bacterium]
MSRPLGFPPSVRLTHSRDFNRVFRRADIRNRHGALRIAAAANRMMSPRMGLVVPKRTIRKAVERNRIKRVLREEFRKRRLALPAFDIVIHVMARVDNARLRADVDVLFTRLATSAGDET